MQLRHRWSLWLVFAFLLHGGVRAEDGIEVGMSRDAVVKAFGEPPSRMAHETRTVLIYPHLRVVLHRDVVSSYTWLVPPEKRRVLRSSPPAPARSENAMPSAPRAATDEQEAQRAATPKSAVAQRSPQVLQLPPEKATALIITSSGLSAPGWKMAIVGIGVLTCLVMAAMWRLMRRARRRRVGDANVPDAGGSSASLNEADDLAAAVEQATREVRAQTTPIVAATAAPPTELTPELLRLLEWKRFEELVAGYYNATGVRAELTCTGADGGVDVKLYRAGEARPFAYVQCKAWIGRDAGVKVIRELFGVMAADQVSEGVFVTTGEFSDDARAFARGRPIRLIDGAEFVRLFGELSAPARSEILGYVMRGDYTTPTCARCDVKMVLRKAGAQAFWGCPHYPRCRAIINLRAA